MSDNSAHTAYWDANIRLIRACLGVWLLASIGFGILFRPLLARIQIGGADLGFWFAQQGSILVFLVLIFYYAWRVSRLDREHGVED